MKSFFSRSRYKFISHMTLWTSLVYSLPSRVYAEDKLSALMGKQSEEAKYTVNFNDTSVIEVIRFVSKITGANFVFKESDLQFNVTIVSEEPISARNFTSALVQVLRINGLTLLEQEGNFLITQAASGVNQIPTLVAGEETGNIKTSAPLVTRVFRIKNADASNIASILRPLTSQSSLIEVSSQTKQLIITDVTTNVEKIAVLLQSLDTPHSNLEIASYVAKHVYPHDIIQLAEKILSPFKEGNPLIFVPQLETNTLFIISTPYLVEKTLSVVEDVDVPPATFRVGSPVATTEQKAYLYKAMNQPLDSLLRSLRAVVSEFPKNTSSQLLKAAEQAKALSSTGSLFFITDAATWTEIQAILEGLDTLPSFGPAGKPTVWLYRVQYVDPKKLQQALKQATLGSQDLALQTAIETSRWIEDSHSLAFTGQEEVIDKIRSLLTNLDVATPSLEVFTYKVQKANDADLISALQQTAESSQDPLLKQAIGSMKWMKESHTLLFNLPHGTLDKLLPLLQNLDTSRPAKEPHAQNRFYSYQVEKAKETSILSSLKELATSSQNEDLLLVVNKARWIADAHLLVFSGPEDVLTELKQILPHLDVPSGQDKEFLSYQPEHLPPEKLLSSLLETASSLQNKNLVDMIKEAKFLKESNILLFSGSKETLSKLRDLLPSLDIANSSLELYTYKIQRSKASDLMTSLHKMAEEGRDYDLAQAIKTMQWFSESNVLVFHASANALTKLQALLPLLDSPLVRSDTRFYTYQVQNGSEAEIRSSLHKMLETIKDPDFALAVQSMKWIPESRLLVFQGSEETLSRLQTLLPTLDLPAHSGFFTYQVQNGAEEEMQKSLRKMAETIQDPDFTQAVQSMQWIPETRLLVFHGKEEALSRLRGVVPTLDLAPQVGFYTYKIQNGSHTEIEASLTKMAESTQDPDFLRTVRSMRWIPESNLLVFNGKEASLLRLQSLLPTLDIASNRHFATYKVQNGLGEQMIASLRHMAETIQDVDFASAVHSMRWNPSAHILVFSGTTEALARVQSLLPSLDIASNSHFATYKVQNGSGEQIIASLHNMAKSIQDPDFVSAAHSMRWIPESNLLVFSGTTEALARLQGLLPSLDTPSAKTDLLTYKIVSTPSQKLLALLKELGEAAQDADLLSTIKQAKWVQESNTLLFTGTPTTLTKLQNLLPIIDVPTAPAPAPSDKSQFLLYTPKYQTGEELEKNLRELAQDFANAGLENGDFLTALKSVKWVVSSQSLVFTGNTASLDRIQIILQNVDAPSAQASLQTWMYKPVYATQTQLQEALTLYAQGLNPNLPSDEALSQTIYRAQWVPKSESFLFKADAVTLGRLKGVLASIDTPKGLAGTSAQTFFLYRLQKAQGNIVVQSLKDLADNLPPNDMSSISVAKSLQSLKWIQENNAILITGSSYAIEQVKTLIAEFDVDVPSKAPVIADKNDFFIYKATSRSPEEISQALRDLTTDLKSSSFADQELLEALQSVRVVSATHSLLFTGTPSALAKVKALLPTIDTQAEGSIQTIGETVFFIYKIKKAEAEELITAIKSFAGQLGESNLDDRELDKSLSSVKWIKETNSLLFVGTQSTLQKVEPLVTKFDLGTLPQQPAAAPRAVPETFFVYTPQNQTGEALIAILDEFMNNLSQSGLSDASLFDTIRNLKFIEKTNSLVLTGEAAAIQKIQELLVKFDVPSAQTNAASIAASNFLIYKLQYHAGDDIQVALKQVASSLNNTSSETNQALVDAINSLQWVEITNSLLGTGTAETLKKVKELIASLDVPLRQVFIEVLVIETTLFNSQNFGLQWGTQLQYLNKTIGAMGNFPTTVTNNLNNTNQPPGTVNFSSPLSYTTNVNPPVQGNSSLVKTAVPFSTGFDLGVIGDIIFHKGKSFISLGSLLNALQTDNDTSVVMNPKIITQDGRKSTIFVGQNIPFVGSFISNTASNTLTSSNIEYRDVGVNLEITPTLGTNNIITLEIKQDISEQTPNTTQVQGSQVTGIQTSHTSMNTRVHVPDQHFLVLSGMIQDRKVHFRSSIPCLGGLPVIGALFSENDRADTKSNVIIFLRPYIIDTVEDYERITNAEEDLYRQQAGPQDLKEEFDAGVEMIRNLNNE